MKRMKRDRAQRAWQNGYLAGVKGRSSDMCPHEATAARAEWMTGWREGHEDLRANYRGPARAERLQEVANGVR